MRKRFRLIIAIKNIVTDKKQLKFLHIFQKIGNPIRKSQVDDFGKDDFIWARRNFWQRPLRH
jgi:hypothetical protein